MSRKFDVWSYVAPTMMMRTNATDDDESAAYATPESPWVAA